MDCRTSQTNLTAWLDSELDQEFEKRIREHVDRCAGCQAVLEDHRRERLFLQRHASELELSPSLWPSIVGRIESQENKVSLSWWHLLKDWIGLSSPRMRPAGVWASVMAAVFLGLGLWVTLEMVVPTAHEQQVQQMMEEYIRMRELQERGSQLGASFSSPNVEVWKASNPFLQEKPPDPERNPFDKSL